MPQLILCISLFFCFQTNSYSQRNNIPNVFQLSISDHGLAKSSASSFVEYRLNEFKLDYTYNYTGSMGMSDFDEHAKKKFGHREQRGLHHFLEEAQELFSEDLNFKGDPSEHVVEIHLNYTLNGEVKSWKMVGGRKKVEAQEAYKKILELEDLIREMIRLEPR